MPFEKLRKYMKILIKLLSVVGIILLAFIVALLLVIGLYFIKPYITSREPKLSLELNEVVVRSREIVNSYWQHHAHCPSAKNLASIEQLPLVKQVKVKAVGDRQCLVTVKVRIENGVIKVIDQQISFTKLDKPRVYYSCYHNSVTHQVPNSCSKVRDIDSFDL